jgi:hypothetical protein
MKWEAELHGPERKGKERAKGRLSGQGWLRRWLTQKMGVRRVDGVGVKDMGKAPYPLSSQFGHNRTIYTHTCTHHGRTRMHAHTRAGVDTHAHTYARRHTHTHTHTQTHTQTHIEPSPQCRLAENRHIS